MRLLFVFLMLVSCGTDKSTYPQPHDPPVVVGPNPGTDPGSGPTSFLEASAIMQKYCVSCHRTDAFITDESALRGSSSKARVQSSNMPPSYAPLQMSGADKEKFLNFFSG